MKVSLNWLKEYLNLDNISKEELYNAFSLHINEVETVKPLIEGTNLEVGEVLECEMHPNSDHLHICQVKLSDKVEQIVCGAPNIKAGQKVIVARVGAVLKDGKIKDAKLRGVESHGMICSLQELGISESEVEEAYREGIYVLPNDVKTGAKLEEIGFNDTIYDLELTSNRSDLLSIEGVAYDLGAVLKQKVSPKVPNLKENRRLNPLKIEIDTPNCYKFCARLIEGVEIKESPLWLKLKLMSAGIRPINNVVDITNLVLMEFGQPLHAYNYDAYKESNLVLVRNAYDNEEFVTLDGNKRILTKDDIVVTNGKEPLCLGGIMGGLKSEVENDTKDILLEAAYFAPLSIRKTSSRLNLKSESSIRFERNIDEERVERALDYAAMLISQLASGTVVGNMVRCVKKEFPTKIVKITDNKVNSFLGTNLTHEEIADIFTNLDYTYTYLNDEYEITLPKRRMDLEASWQDVIEDVSRMLGYDNIPTTIRAASNHGILTREQKLTRSLRQTLSTLGLNEVITYSLVSEKDLNTYNVSELKDVKVLMPLTSDREYMRKSLLNGLVDVLKYNKARKMSDVNIFEIGRRYELNNEEDMLAMLMTGTFEQLTWQNKVLKVDFYVIAGLIKEALRRLNYNVTLTPYKDIKETYHPNRAAHLVVNGVDVGFVASLHPKFRLQNDLDDTYVLELNLTKLFKLPNDLNYEAISKYPTIERDLALILPKNMNVGEVLNKLSKISKTLINVSIFDLYEGVNIKEGYKSVAFKLLFGDKTRTLESSEVDNIIQKILKELAKEDINLRD